MRAALVGFEHLKWHTRSGAPHSLEDLESVAAGQASTIVLLHTEDEQVRPPPPPLYVP